MEFHSDHLPLRAMPQWTTTVCSPGGMPDWLIAVMRKLSFGWQWSELEPDSVSNQTDPTESRTEMMETVDDYIIESYLFTHWGYWGTSYEFAFDSGPLYHESMVEDLNYPLEAREHAWQLMRNRRK